MNFVSEDIEEPLLEKDENTRWMYKEDEVLLWIQSWSRPAMDYFAIFCAYLIFEDVMLLLVVFLLLADPYHILPFALWFIIQELSNGIVKWIFQHPRPFFVYENVRILELTLEQGFSFPSSHAQCFGFISFGLTLTYGWNFWTVILYPLGFAGSLTRVYLGLHFLHDVFAGWVFALIWTFIWYESRTMEDWFETPDFGRVAFIIACAIIIPLAFFLVKKIVPPPSREQIEIWENTCLANHPRNKRIPLRERSFDSYVAFYALLMGALIGLEMNLKFNVIAYYFEVFRPQNVRRIFPRIAVGLIGTVLIVGSYEIIRKNPIVKKLEQPHRFVFLFSPPFMLGLLMTQTMPILAEYHGWMN